MWSRCKRAAGPVLFWLAVWELAALVVDGREVGQAWALWRSGGGAAALLEHLARGKELLLPAPLAVGERLWELCGTPEFWRTALASLGRILGGALAGIALGTALAGLTSAAGWADRLFSPAVKVLRATPVASFIVLVLLWVEKDLVPAVISALMVLPVIWGMVCKGISETDGALLEMAGAYRFGRWKTVRLIYVPMALPYFAGACRTALGLAWKAGVAAEVLCMPKYAIGTQVYFSKIYLEIPDLFAWTLAVVALSLLLERGMVALMGRLTWSGRGTSC